MTVSDDDIYQFLFDLQASGVTNMFGAVPYIQNEFKGVSKARAQKVLMNWMVNYASIKARLS